MKSSSRRRSGEAGVVYTLSRRIIPSVSFGILSRGRRKVLRLKRSRKTLYLSLHETEDTEVHHKHDMVRHSTSICCCRVYNRPHVRDTLNSGHLSNEDSAYCPSYIEMCTKLPLK